MTQSFQKTLWLSLLLFFQINVFAQTGNSKEPKLFLSPREFQEDFTILRASLEEGHPGLYWYTSKKEFDKIFDSTYALLSKQLTKEDFVRLILPIISKIKCDHTLFFPSEDVLLKGRRFPFDVKFINDDCYLIRKYSPNKIPIGSKIISINGHPIKGIVEIMCANITSQGGNKMLKYTILESEFSNLYYFLLGNPKYFRIKYQSLKGETFQTKVPSSDSLKIKEMYKNWMSELNAHPKPLEWAIKPEISTAILTVRTFMSGYYETKQISFPQFLDSAFSEIKNAGIKNLVIDLRDNFGGSNPYSIMLYSYLADSSFRYIESLETTTDQRLSFLKYTDIKDTNGHNSAYNKLNGPITNVGGKYYCLTSEYVRPHSPAKNNFLGAVYVLTNKKTASASIEFLSMAEYNNRAIRVGERTSGCLKGGCAGQPRPKLKLPNTGFTFEIPLMKFNSLNRNANTQAGQGFSPHYVSIQSIDDYLNNNDVVLKYTINLITGLK